MVDAAGGLGDVNWSDDDALDAMVDDIGREVDGKRLRERNYWLPGLVWLVCWFGGGRDDHLHSLPNSSDSLC